MPALTVKSRGKNYVVYNEGVIRVDNVIASYPHLAKPYAGKNKTDDQGKEKTPKFSIVGMLKKETHVDAKNAVRDFIDAMLKEKDAGAVASDKKFLRNGDDSGKDSYAGHWTISASETNRPACRDRKGNLVDQDKVADLFYGGCLVNILIRPWYQDGKTTGAGYGKRVNAGLIGVQFVAGEAEGYKAFGEGRIDDSDAWDTGGDDGGSRSDDDDL